MSALHRVVLTIGHSTHSIGRFVILLSQHRVTAVADVRSTPYSRFNPQFNRETLEEDLRKHGIRYVFLGQELGARSDDSSCYEKGRVRYSRLVRTERFRHGVGRVVRGSETYQIALLCAEKEPLDCHRTLLVAPALEREGFRVAHILGDGGLESHQDAMERLLDVMGLPHDDLLRSHEELVSEAMSRQEEKIAYVDQKLAAGASGETG